MTARCCGWLPAAGCRPLEFSAALRPEKGNKREEKMNKPWGQSRSAFTSALLLENLWTSSMTSRGSKKFSASTVPIRLPVIGHPADPSWPHTHRHGLSFAPSRRASTCLPSEQTRFSRCALWVPCWPLMANTHHELGNANSLSYAK